MKSDSMGLWALLVVERGHVTVIHSAPEHADKLAASYRERGAVVRLVVLDDNGNPTLV